MNYSVACYGVSLINSQSRSKLRGIEPNFRNKDAICSTIREQNLTTVADVKRCPLAGTGCGGCVSMLTDILKSEMKRAGKKVFNHICEHFAYSRQELYQLIRVHEIKSFEELLTQYGQRSGLRNL